MGIKTKIKNYFQKIEKLKILEKNYFEETLTKKLFLENNNFDIKIIIYEIKAKERLLKCINFIEKNIDNNLNYEIVVISSINEFNQINKKIKFIFDEVNNIQTLNKEIKNSKNEYIYLINCEFDFQKNTLSELLFVYENFNNVGLVTSIIKNKILKEVNCGYYLLRNNSISSISNNLKFQSPDLKFIQKIDICNQSVLIKNENLSSIDVFEENFCLINFCIKIKKDLKKEIYCNPYSIVFTEKNDNKIQNKLKLIDFTSVIKSNTNQERIQELYLNKSVVIFCGMFPEHDKDSGSNRLREIILAFKKLNFLVIFVCKNVFVDHEYIEEYQKNGINVFYEFDLKTDIKTYLSNKKLISKLSWFYSPNTFNEFFKIAKQVLPYSKLVYDMVDIHHLRYERAIELEPKRISLRKKYKKYLKLEIESAKKCDYLISISEFEEKYMSQFCETDKIITISNIHFTKVNIKNTLEFSKRKNILFIGSMHEPNIDGLNYLFNDIMPIVWTKIPEMKVNIIGNVNQVVKNLNHPNFNFLGFVPNIENLFCANKMMVAPLRYGAGVKGKIGQALEYHLPVVTSSIGAEGMKLINRENACIEDSKKEFAEAIIEVYNNETLWTKLQNNSEKSLKPFSRENLLHILNKL